MEEGKGSKVPRSKGSKVQRSKGPIYLKLTFKYELDSKEGPSCFRFQLKYLIKISLLTNCYQVSTVFQDSSPFINSTKAKDPWIEELRGRSHVST